VSVALVSSQGDAHVRHLVDLFGNEWWSRGRSVAEVQTVLGASDVVLAAIDSDRDELVGFARALTDGVFVAVVLDVIVAGNRRGEQIGRMLMQEMLRRLDGVNSIELVCQPDLEAFYAQWGFTTRVGRSRLMRRTNDSTLAD